MSLKKPLALSPGDTIALIAPASPPPQPELIQRSEQLIQSLGFKVFLGSHVGQRHGFLAGSDRDRLTDLRNVFNAKDVRGIICIRGGYGVARILNQIKFPHLAKSLKIFVGSSDLTSFLGAANKFAKAVTFHGPMPKDLLIENAPPYSLEHLRLTLRGDDKALGSICKGYADREATIEVVRKGRVTAPIVGGNLAILSSLLATPYFPTCKGKILFIEEVGEPPYKIDRSLTHLINAGVFEGVKGVAFGLFHRCHDPLAKNSTEYRQSAIEVIRERTSKLTCPVVLGLPFGHAPYAATLPYGCRATLDGKLGDLILEELGTR